jgi:hypothetical protein
VVVGHVSHTAEHVHLGVVAARRRRQVVTMTMVTNVVVAGGGCQCCVGAHGVVTCNVENTFIIIKWLCLFYYVFHFSFPFPYINVM